MRLKYGGGLQPDVATLPLDRTREMRTGRRVYSNRGVFSLRRGEGRGGGRVHYPLLPYLERNKHYTNSNKRKIARDRLAEAYATARPIAVLL